MHFCLGCAFILNFTEYITFTGLRKSKWDFLQTMGTSLMFTSPRSHGGLKPPQYLLEGPCIREQAIQQVPRGHCWLLLDTHYWEADEWGDTWLYLMLTSKEIVLGDVKYDGNLDDAEWWCKSEKEGTRQKAGSQPQASVGQTLTCSQAGPCPVQFENLLWAPHTLWMSFSLFHHPVFCPFVFQLLYHPLSLQQLSTLTELLKSICCGQLCTDTAFDFSDLFRFPVWWGFYSFHWTFQYHRSKWS